MEVDIEKLKELYAELNYPKRIEFVKWITEMENPEDGYTKREKFRKEIKRDVGPINSSVCPYCLK